MEHTNVQARPVKSIRVRRKVIRWVALGVVVLLVVAYLGIGAIAASQLTLPKRISDPAINPGVYYLQYESFKYPARHDGVQIAAWYIPSKENQRAIILVPGRDSSRSKGFGDQFVYFASVLQKAGFSILMIDLRGHGDSADARFSFGIKERNDVTGGVDWLVARGYQPGKIGVLGFSLGAASVIGAAYEEEGIGAIWIDSSYADINSVIERNWVAESGLPQVFLYSTEGMIRFLYGYDIAASRPIDEIGKIAPRPIFIAHCQQDNLIPISHMDRLLSVAQNAQSWVIANCDQHSIGKVLGPERLNNHATGYNIQPAEYEQKVIQFFKDSIK